MPPEHPKPSPIAPVAPTITSSTTATSTVGAAFSTTVHTTGIPTAAITESGALPSGVTFTNNGDGTATIAGTPAAGTGGTYPITITATNSAGSTTQAFLLTNAEAPTITSAATAAFTTGLAGTYTMTTTGYPTATLTETGALPTGLSFVDNGNGTGTLSGTPAAGTAGTYPVSLSATNASGSTATLALTITVADATAPAITSGNSGYFTLNQAGAIGITTTGSPTPTITESGALPPGLTFTDNGNGTALIQGTPTALGTTTLTVTAHNGIGTDATQTVTIIVGQAPAFTSPATATAQLNTAFSDTVTTSGYPAPNFGWSNVPPGLSVTDNGNGTLTISGTPTTAGTYTMPLTAVSAYGTAQQTLTITVQQPAAITSASSTTFTAGSAGTFSVTTTGSPTAAITESGALPTGVTLVDNHDGTATLSGTPAAGSQGSYPITLTAANGVSPNATQSFTLTVRSRRHRYRGPAPSPAPARTVTFTAPGSDTAGPPRLAFDDNATARRPLRRRRRIAGSYPITITAANGVGTNATQNLVLTVNAAIPPDFTSAATTFASRGGPSDHLDRYPDPDPDQQPALPPGSPSKTTATGPPPGGTPAAGSQGVYTLTVTAASSGTATQRFALTVNSGLAITSASSATLTDGTPLSFTVTTTGTPTPTLTHTGTLPSGVTFTDNANGTATLAGTPASTDSGSYLVTITAKNSTGTTSQVLTLTVTQVPSFSSAAAVTETAGTAFSFTVSTKGDPTPQLTAGTLPAGVSFSDTGNGTGVLSGTGVVAAGAYSIPLTAKNAGGTTSQAFVLTVKAAGTPTQTVPAFTSAATATATAGTAFSFTVTTAGSPTTTYTTNVSRSGTLPGGISFNNNGNGTATLTGTPSATSGGTYPITFKATNTAGTTTQSFVLTVSAAPRITTTASTTATVGSGFNFTVKTTGAPAPALTESGALPQGVTWTDNGNGTATLAGTPGVGQGNVYTLTITAKNSAGSVTQSFTLTVNQAPGSPAPPRRPQPTARHSASRLRAPGIRPRT